MNMEQWWNDIFAGETEVLGENLPSSVNIQLKCHPAICSPTPRLSPPLHIAKLHVTRGLSLAYKVTVLTCVELSLTFYCLCLGLAQHYGIEM
jgi:hypothetical protein